MMTFLIELEAVENENYAFVVEVARLLVCLVEALQQ
jgi:hypothetical protein